MQLFSSSSSSPLSLSLLFLSSLLASSTLAASDPIVSKGTKFFYSGNGSQFFIKGIAYQSDTTGTSKDYIDPLADEETCKRDLPYLVDLGTNALRVYAVDPDANHDACMKMFDDAGIYIIADLSNPKVSINRYNPSWDVDHYERYTAVIDNLQQYDNVLGFFAGNEVTISSNNTAASPFVKAAVRDCKAYIKEKGYREIPVGYSSNDDIDTRIAMANYFACGDSEDAADFYGINVYEWCGESSFKLSGYSQLTTLFENMTIPVFFSEYGCNEKTPRKFTEVGTIYGDDMIDVWSGGIVYMYFEEANNYGLVSIDKGKVKTLTDYGYLSSEIAKVTPKGVKSADYTPTATGEFQCPPTDGPNWKAALELPPTPNEDLCDCVHKGLKCVLADDVDEDDYSELFGIVCGKGDCSSITANGTTGVYGAFSGCQPKEQLSVVLNQYYLDNDSSDSACNFDGMATLQSSSNSTCESLISNAIKSATQSSSGSKSSSKGSGTSSSSSSKASGSSLANVGYQVDNGSLMMVGVMILSGLFGVSIIF